MHWCHGLSGLQELEACWSSFSCRFRIWSIQSPLIRALLPPRKIEREFKAGRNAVWIRFKQSAAPWISC